MITLSMTPRDRRALAAGAIIVMLVALTRGVPAWRAWQRDARAAARVATADLARAELRVQLRRQCTDSLAARDQRFVALAPALLSGDTPAAAGATLAGLVSGAVAAAGVRLGAVQVRADTTHRATFTRIAVEADGTGDIRDIARWLATLERGPALVAVRALAITQPAPAAPANQMETLQATFTVEGLMLTPRQDHT